jgi:D-alanyl-D-alanine carboxypeptidase (penicillin-binding protein 5/6)
MTAYVILLDHPLPEAEQGPDITVEPSEAAAYSSQAREGDSLVAVAAGEVISERQALEALLLPSADNMAWILARWDAGSQAAFTAKMNATARRLGMTGTNYTDASGLDSSTVSTAADQVRLGMAAMGVPALAAITAMPTAVVPVVGQPGTAGTDLLNALQAGHRLVLALDHALGADGRSGPRRDSGGPPQGPPGAL